MKAALIQRQIKLNEQILTGLHEEYKNLREARKMYNERADECFKQMMIADDQLDFDASHQYTTEGEANREQASMFTPYIRKFKKKIAAVEEIQRCLKDDLKGQQALEAWIVEDDAFWIQQAYVARQEGYSVTYSFDEAAKLFVGEG
jgi:hypothetical protein